jgi:hypothetical protein
VKCDDPVAKPRINSGLVCTVNAILKLNLSDDRRIFDQVKTIVSQSKSVKRVPMKSFIVRIAQPELKHSLKLENSNAILWSYSPADVIGAKQAVLIRVDRGARSPGVHLWRFEPRN